MKICRICVFMAEDYPRSSGQNWCSQHLKNVWNIDQETTCPEFIEDAAVEPKGKIDDYGDHDR